MMRKGILAMIPGFLLAICLTSFLPGCATGQMATTPAASPVEKPAASPTAKPATTVHAGTLLYQADWSRDLAAWQAGPAWSVTQGNLQLQTADTTSIIIPYKPTVANYALEARVQIVRQLIDHGASFSFFAKPVAGEDGYIAGVSDLRKGPSPAFSHPQSQIFIDPESSQRENSFRPIDYEPGTEWHSYRIEVRGAQAIWLIDGHGVGTAASEKTLMLSHGPLGLMGTGIVLQISGLRITAL